VRIDDIDAMRWTDALKVGLAQAFALISARRARATIIGGMFGLSRRAATEFSFFLTPRPSPRAATDRQNRAAVNC
jgi:undecaprenyl-diphosphatase